MSESENFIVRRSSVENKEKGSFEQKSSLNSNQQLDEFASGLPSWDLVPPQMVIKRVKRVL